MAPGIRLVNSEVFELEENIMGSCQRSVFQWPCEVASVFHVTVVDKLPTFQVVQEHKMTLKQEKADPAWYMHIDAFLSSSDSKVLRI